MFCFHKEWIKSKWLNIILKIEIIYLNFRRHVTRWEKHASRMGKIKSAYRDLVGNRRERGHLENLSV